MATQPPPEDDALRLTLKRHLLVKEAARAPVLRRVTVAQAEPSA